MKKFSMKFVDENRDNLLSKITEILMTAIIKNIKF